MIQSASEGSLQVGIVGFQDEPPTSAPLIVRMTTTAKMRKNLGRDRRFSTKRGPFPLFGGGLFEEQMITNPRPPINSDVRPFSSHSCPAPATAKRQAQLRQVEAMGKDSWEGPKAKEPVPQPKSTDVPCTWSSSMRAALAHSRRAAAQVGLDVPTGSFNIANSDCRGPPSAKGPAPGRPIQTRRIQQSPCLQSDARGHAGKTAGPMLMKGWARRCFADAGLGIGERFPIPAIARYPGPGSYGNHYGDVGLWNPDHPLPTKQPSTKHVSAETHRCGVRRENADREAGPGPGYYDQQTFVDEILNREEHASRPKVLQMPSSWCSIP